MEPFVDAAWLREHLDEVTVCDVRWTREGVDGRAGHADGHIPGAVHVELDRDLAAAPSKEEGRHPLPDPATWSATLGRLGLDRSVPVVAYDDGVGAIAARLVWMLRATGFDAALLDGGLDAWDGELETGPVLARPTIVPLAPWPRELLADIDEVADASIVLDARDAARYRGDDPGPDARAGHIPGARHAPFTANVDEHGRLRDEDELRAHYEALLEGGTAIASCGSGVTACLGLPSGRLFPGSWSQWAADLGRRVAVGDEPG